MRLVSIAPVSIAAGDFHPPLELIGDTAAAESPSLESIRYRATSKSFVAAEDPFTSTSSLYFPAGHPSGFET